MINDHLKMMPDSFCEKKDAGQFARGFLASC